MDNITRHKNDDISIVWKGCTIYAVAFYEDSEGIAVDFDFQSTLPQTGIALYLFKEKLNLTEDDKIVSDEDYNIYISYGNGEKVLINEEPKDMGVYYFDRDDSDSPYQKEFNGIMSESIKEVDNEEEARFLTYTKIADKTIANNIHYYGECLMLTTFNSKPCLWITNINQRFLPRIQFVGGYPNEYCVFLDDLTEEDKKHLFYLNNEPATIEELKKMIIE